VGGACSTNFEMINAYRNVVRRTKGSMLLRRRWRRWENSFGRDNRDVGYYEIDNKPSAFKQGSVLQDCLSK